MSVALNDEPRTGASARHARTILLALLALGPNVGCGRGSVRAKPESWLEAAVFPGNYRPHRSSLILTASLRERDERLDEQARAEELASVERPVAGATQAVVSEVLLAAFKATGIVAPGSWRSSQGAIIYVVARPSAAEAARDATSSEGSAARSPFAAETANALGTSRFSLIEACQITKIPPPMPVLDFKARDAEVSRTAYGKPNDAHTPPADPGPAADPPSSKGDEGRSKAAPPGPSPENPKAGPLGVDKACKSTKNPRPASRNTTSKTAKATARVKKGREVLAARKAAAPANS